MREAGSGTRAVLEAALRERGLDPAALGIALELPSNEAVRSAVAAGAGISGLSSLVVEAMIDAGRLVALPIDLAPRPFLALRPKESYRSRAADALTATLYQDTHLRNRETSATPPPELRRAHVRARVLQSVDIQLGPVSFKN